MNSSNTFANRLGHAIAAVKNPLVVGIDPRLDLLPRSLVKKHRGDLGRAVREFSLNIVNLAAGNVAAIKPQFAYFEALGAAGLASLKEVVHDARQKDLLVIGDAKRGDIGSTASAYAKAYLDRSNINGIFCDALTVTPYMGFDTIEPFAETAKKNDAGLFVLVKTSNPGSGEFQDQRYTSGETLYESVAAAIQRQNENWLARHPNARHAYGPIGAVVGATYPGQLAELRKLMPNTIFLIPGFGAQGGTVSDIAGGFQNGTGAVVNSSRGIIYAFRNDADSDDDSSASETHWQDAVERALTDTIDQLRPLARQS